MVDTTETQIYSIFVYSISGPFTERSLQSLKLVTITNDTVVLGFVNDIDMFAFDRAIVTLYCPGPLTDTMNKCVEGFAHYLESWRPGVQVLDWSFAGQEGSPFEEDHK